jgi:hypothetical protein
MGTYFWGTIAFHRAEAEAAVRAEQQVKVVDAQRAFLEQRVKDLQQRLDNAKIPK